MVADNIDDRLVLEVTSHPFAPLATKMDVTRQHDNICIGYRNFSRSKFQVQIAEMCKRIVRLDLKAQPSSRLKSGRLLLASPDHRQGAICRLERPVADALHHVVQTHARREVHAGDALIRPCSQFFGGDSAMRPNAYESTRAITIFCRHGSDHFLADPGKLFHSHCTPFPAKL